jgi:hypothetical protein
MGPLTFRVSRFENCLSPPECKALERLTGEIPAAAKPAEAKQNGTW